MRNGFTTYNELQLKSMIIHEIMRNTESAYDSFGAKLKDSAKKELRKKLCEMLSSKTVYVWDLSDPKYTQMKSFKLFDCDLWTTKSSLRSLLTDVIKLKINVNDVFVDIYGGNGFMFFDERTGKKMAVTWHDHL